MAKIKFEHPGGPKRLEWRGTKLEQVTGASWDLEMGGALNFGPGTPKKAQERPKMAKYNSEHFRDPKRLEQYGAKLERVTGSPG